MREREREREREGERRRNQKNTSKELRVGSKLNSVECKFNVGIPYCLRNFMARKNLPLFYSLLIFGSLFHVEPHKMR